MKKFILPLILLLTLLITLHVSAEEEEIPLLSPGISKLADKCILTVSASAGEDILIVKEDFLRTLNKSDIEDIVILSLPNISEGTLTLAGNGVNVGERIASDNISALCFSPAGDYITDSSFVFRDCESSLEYTCRLSLLSGENSAPISNTAGLGSYISTFEGISLYSSLPGYDPDGDTVEFMITSYPRKGYISLDSSSGKYSYTPSEGFTGNDSFTYVLYDRYGHFSGTREVSVSVSSLEKEEIFCDMEDSKLLSEAIFLSREGIMGGSTVGGKLVFKPSAEISRSEFVSLLLSAAGADIGEGVIRTVFYDDSEIPAAHKSAVAAAYELGITDGFMDGERLCFKPNDTITRAECAEIMGRLLDIEADASLPVIADPEDCPEDYLDSVSLLCALYILPTEGGEANASLPLTREYAAGVLSNVKTFITFSLLS